MKTGKFIAFAMVVLLSMNSIAQEKCRITKSVMDKMIIAIKDSLNIPGIAVGIAIDDKIIYSNTFGYANLETETKLTGNSIWHICSVSKQFSTVACMKLVEENKISLNDKISLYIDDLPAEYIDIRVFNLLSHTSGIKDYLNDRDLFGLPWEKVKRELFADTLNFAPGTAWSYSNTGFWIVARIIEKVTGIDYDKYLEQEFFTRLKMDQTHILTSSEIVKQRVEGYVYTSDRFLNSTLLRGEYYGQRDGDLMSTISDLLKWNIALTHNKIISEDLTNMLWSSTKLNNGKSLEAIPNTGTSYGLGWFINEINGDKVVWTPGAGFGFSISSLYIPKYDLNIIVFCNKDQFLMADDIGFSIAKRILQTGP